MRFETQPLAAGEAEVRARHEANRASWNEAAVRYTEEIETTIAFLRTGGSNLHPLERAMLGDLHTFGAAVHLQCASGKDTLSLWNEGVGRVIGVDISDLHIANARRTGEALGAPAAWYRSDVLEAPAELDGTADLVYTGRGAIGWIHDLEGWAAVVRRLLRPGGVLSLFDDHPATWLFDTDAESYVHSGVDYFAHAESSQGWGPTYIGDLGVPVERLSPKFERLWTLGAVFGTLRRAGLAVEHLGEHPETYWNGFPNLAPELRGKIPMTFSLLARRPG